MNSRSTLDRIIVSCPHTRFRNLEEVVDAKVEAAHPQLDLLMIRLEKAIPNPVVPISAGSKVKSLIQLNRCFAFGYGQTDFHSEDGGENHRGLRADFEMSFGSLFDKVVGGRETMSFKPILRSGDSGGALVCADKISTFYLVGVHHSGSSARSYSTHLASASDWVKGYLKLP